MKMIVLTLRVSLMPFSTTEQTKSDDIYTSEVDHKKTDKNQKSDDDEDDCFDSTSQSLFS